jgi:hypothetical protein
MVDRTAGLGATDVTVDELSIETFYPADDETAATLRATAG